MKRLTRELFGIDPRSLAAFRIAIGVLLLVDLGVRATDLGVMYTDDGMFSRALICRHFSAWNWSFHFGSGSWPYQAVLFGCSAVFASALLVGYETRLATVASWILLISLQNRIPNILTGADNLLRLLLFWGMFLPLGRAWSVDGWLGKRRGARRASVSPVLSVASAAILLQMAFMYLFSAVFKSNADWFSGKAIAGILVDGFYGKPIALGLVGFPRVLAVLTIGVLALEWLGPFVLFSPLRTGWLRLWVIGLLASMHLGIEILLKLGWFSYVSVAGLLLFLPTSFWNKLPGRSRVRDRDSARPELLQTISPGPASPVVTFAANGTCALALAFALFANVNELPGRFVPWTPLPRFEFLTVSCGLGQKWDMFAEIPPRNGWFVARATLLDGTAVDLLRHGAPVSWERPHYPAGVYPNHRWQKCFREMSYTDERGYQVFREPVSDYLCRSWNRNRTPARRISDFVLVFCMEGENELGLGSAPATIRETLVHLDFAARDEKR